MKYGSDPALSLARELQHKMQGYNTVGAPVSWVRGAWRRPCVVGCAMATDGDGVFT